jgi:hypothetical protein
MNKENKRNFNYLISASAFSNLADGNRKKIKDAAHRHPKKTRRRQKRTKSEIGAGRQTKT